MSKTLEQIFVLNPITTNMSTDLMYFVQSPYTPGTDAGMTFANFSAQFGAPVTPSALSRTNDTNVTLTLGGTPATALLQATSITAGWSGQLAVGRGGTGNSTFTAFSVICAGTTATGAFQNVSGLGNIGQQLTSNGPGALPTWQSGTVSPLTTKGDLYTFTTADARLPVGTIDGQILQVSSGAATGLAWSTATYPSVATNVARLMRADGTNWVQTTSTFADIYAASGFLYANGANNIAGLATATNGLPVTDNAGVPSILAGPAATGRVLTSNAAAAPSWSTSTFPTVGGAAGNILISDGTNYIASTSLWPNTVGATGKILRSNGTANTYSTATYPDTAGTSGNILTSDGTNWLSSAPAASGTVNSGTANQLAYYATTGTAVSGLTSANNGMLVTSGAGVPSISSTFGQGLAMASSVLGVGSANNIPFNDNKGIQDSNGNNVLTFTATGSAVNFINMNNAIAGGTPSIGATGSSTDIILNIVGKGTGGVAIQGTSTNNNASSGYVGEFISSVILNASPVSINSNTATDLTSISLTAGDWDVWGNITFAASAVAISQAYTWCSVTSATLPDSALYAGETLSGATVLSGLGIPTILIRISVSMTTTVYVSGYITFTGGTANMRGGIYARRVR